jgi:hypothetical protein
MANPAARAPIERGKRPIIQRTLFGNIREQVPRQKLKVPGNGLELVHHRARRLASSVYGGVQAMIHVVMDQLPLCFRNGLFDGVKLLGKIQACAAFAEHRYDPPNMPLGALEPLDDIRMAFMKMSFLHGA